MLAAPCPRRSPTETELGPGKGPHAARLVRAGCGRHRQRLPKEEPRVSKFVKLTGLWKNKSGNGYSGGLREDVTIPAGGRVFLFKVKDEDLKPNGPVLELCFVPPDEEQRQTPAVRRIAADLVDDSPL
jgi:hypothetical protein